MSEDVTEEKSRSAGSLRHLRLVALLRELVRSVAYCGTGPVAVAISNRVGPSVSARKKEGTTF